MAAEGWTRMRSEVRRHTQADRKKIRPEKLKTGRRSEGKYWIYVKKEFEPKAIFKDKDEGRYVAAELMMNEKKMLHVNIYAPNGAKDFF